MLLFLLVGLLVGAGVDLYRRQRGEWWQDPQALAQRDSLRREFVARASQEQYQLAQVRTDSGAPQRGAQFRALPRLGVVNVNRASPSELERVPHIGPVLARRIVAHREQHGPFTRIDELKQVKGIGEKTFAKIRPYLIID